MVGWGEVGGRRTEKSAKEEASRKKDVGNKIRTDTVAVPTAAPAKGCTLKIARKRHSEQQRLASRVVRKIVRD